MPDNLLNHIPTLFNAPDPDFEWQPTTDEIAAAVELNTLNSFRLQFRRLRTIFRSFTGILRAGPVDLAGIPGWAETHRERYLEQVQTLTPGREFEKIPADIRIVTYFDPLYPPHLKELYDPPPVLYIRGDHEFDLRSSIAIVGTRNLSDYGRTSTEMFSWQLASWGFTIISGGARGIDSAAHHAAIDSGGKTAAVLGCGIDVVFPSENRKLFQEIPESGALVSEFPMGTIPEKYNFPARNRIIAGLSRGILVTEAPEKSGALITTDLGMQLGREIYAVPGRLTDGRSKGTNLLIQDGAHVVLDPSDIPVSLGMTILESENVTIDNPLQLDGDEALVYESVSLEPVDIDQLVHELGIPAQRLLSAILVLQTRGLVKELPGSRFVRPVNRPK